MVIYSGIRIFDNDSAIRMVSIELSVLGKLKAFQKIMEKLRMITW